MGPYIADSATWVKECKVDIRGFYVGEDAYFGLLCSPEDGGSMFLRNVGINVTSYVASQKTNNDRSSNLSLENTYDGWRYSSTDS